MNHQPPILVVAVCAALGLLACGGDDDPAVGASDSTVETVDCVEVAVDAYGQLDLETLDPADGLDDTERADLDAQIEALEDDHPELAAGGACAEVFDDDAAGAELAAALDPEIIEVLGAAATERFSEVGDAITEGPAGTEPPALDRGACIALIAEQINTLDTTGIDPSDGLDPDETSLIEAHRAEFTARHPELAADGTCTEVGNSLTSEEQQQLSSLIDPEMVIFFGGI